MNSRTEYMRQWRAKNHDKHLENQRLYRERHREKVREANRDYKERNRDAIAERSVTKRDEASRERRRLPSV